MYVQRGCPNCDAAKAFFMGKGISVEAIEIGLDPILQAGFRALTGQAFQTPLTISYLTGEIILGHDPTQLQRVVDSFSAITPNPAP